MSKNLPLVVILGPTASGKTSLAVKLSQKYSGEIICADSRTIYKGMNIGTAKPTKEERDVVPHWGLDLIEPGEYFSVSDFKDYAVSKIKEIRARNKVPFLVGGSGLYIYSIIFDYQFGAKKDLRLREKLQQKSIQELKEYCLKNNIELPENGKNKRYIIRSIENSGSIPEKLMTPIDNCIIVGITTDKNILMNRISKRTDEMLLGSVLQETQDLAIKYGWANEAMTSNIYRAISDYPNNIEQIKSKNITLDWQLAKKQKTWFKRNKFIKWYDLLGAEEYISSYLAHND